jgi:predicted DNA-binding transcriptional regulator AlpA
MQQAVIEAKPGLATAEQAVAFLSLSRTTLWRLERKGVLEPVRIGRAVRYRWADLHELVRGGAA